MHLLAYWRWDNYCRDLGEDAEFNFNSKQARLHSAIEIGETLWLFTAMKDPPRFYLVAKLVVASKAMNPPEFEYGLYRVWGHEERSQYFAVRPDVASDDAFETLRALPLASGSFADCTRATLPQACQTMRGLTDEAHILLEDFARGLAREPTSRE